jgi:HlyD family secretion protein
MGKKFRYFLAGGLVLVIALSILSKKGIFGSDKEGKKVRTGEVKRVDITESIIASGTIQPEKEVKISSEVSGEIVELPIKEGQQIKEGQLLVRINPDIYQSAYERALAALSNAQSGLHQQKVRLELAKTEFLRNKKLFEKGIIAQAEFEKSQTNYKVAQAAYKSAKFQVESARAGVKEAKDNLKRTEIYAPISGTLTRLNVEKGERVVGTKQMAGTEILRIADLGRMEVLTDVNENDIVKVQLKDSALIEIEAFPGRNFKGIVTEIANSAQTQGAALDQTVNFKVKIRILEDSYKDLLKDKPEGFSPFRPGMTASVEIITENKKDVLAVPVAAVTIRKDSLNNEKETVFIYQDGKAERRFVKTGIQNEEYIEILEGLEEGQKIITGPFKLVSKELKDGDEVELMEENKKKYRRKRRP